LIRIGFDARWLNSSGVGTYVYNLLDCFGGLEDDDFEIIVYEHPSNPVPVDNPRLKKQIVKAAKYTAMEQAELPLRCLRDKLDLFHSPFYIVPLMATCPIVATFHDLMAFLFPLYGRLHLEIVKAGYRAAAWKAQSIIADSDMTMNDIESILHVPRRRICRIYPAYSKTMYHEHAEPEEREYLRRQYGITGQYALTLSATNWRTKNLDGAMRAFALAERQSREPFQSVIAGPIEGYKSSGLAGTIRNEIVTGFVPKEDLPKLYRNASAFLSVSLYEGFGIPLLEAMGCGCPAIVSTGGSLPEVAGKAAPAFACDDIQGIANELSRLLSDPEYRQDRRLHGIQRAAEFSYIQSARQTLQLYREVARSRSASSPSAAQI
jgi:glycosyltransferase involved in cell wall biosynthesis